jgi:hypothetical protein
MQNKTTLVLLELTWGLLGWVWLAASAASLYFLVAALAFHGPWLRFWWTIGLSVLAKALATVFRNIQAHLSQQADLRELGAAASKFDELTGPP